MSDPGLIYRSREEVEEYKRTKDCLLFLEKMMVDNKVLDTKGVRAIEKEVRKELDKAVEVAKASPRPKEAAMYENILLEQTPVRKATF